MTTQPTDRTEPDLNRLHTAAIRLHDAIAAAAATTSNPTTAEHLDEAQIAMAPVLTALRRASTVLAVVQPDLDQRDAEIRRLRQHVDELQQAQQATADEQLAHSQTIDERDSASAMADRLAAALAPADVIGEHSDMNDPWQNALDHAAEKTYVAPACACQTAPAAVSGA